MTAILFAQNDTENPIAAWICIIVFVLIFIASIYYLAQIHLRQQEVQANQQELYRKNVERHREHAEKVEQHMERVEALMERIANALERGRDS